MSKKIRFVVTECTPGLPITGEVKLKRKVYSGFWDTRIFVDGTLTKRLKSPSLADASNYVERYADSEKTPDVAAIIEDNGFGVVYIKGRGWSDD